MSRNGRSDKEMFYKQFYPPGKAYDQFLELMPESSQYYAIMVQKFGKAMADYYWNRRYILDQEKDHYYIKLCKEISEKSEKFLKSRGIKLENLWQPKG